MRVNAEFTDLSSSEISRVAELSSPIFNYELVKRCITLSMERGDRERELASRLLSGLYSTVLSVYMGCRIALLICLSSDPDCARRRPWL